MFLKQKLPQKLPQELPMNRLERDFIYNPPDLSKLEQRAVEKTFARCFSTEDGRTVLAWLQTMTFHRALGSGVPEEQLRHMEGQRAMVATILRLIDRGRTG